MFAIIKSFFTANALKIIACVLAIISASAVLFGARQSGKNAERAANLARQSKLVRRSHEIENENMRNLADGAASERLRAGWVRD